MIARLFANGLSGYLAVVGLGALVGAAFALKRAVRLSRGERASGVVTGYSARMRERRTSAIHHMPRFRYQAASLGIYEVQSRVGTTRPERLPPGSEVTVLYDPEYPALAEIAGGGRIWLGFAAFLLLGAGSLVAAWKAGG
jgi:hypothetical protein